MHPGSCLKTCPQTSSDETREVLAVRLGEWRQGRKKTQETDHAGAPTLLPAQGTYMYEQGHVPLNWAIIQQC